MEAIGLLLCVCVCVCVGGGGGGGCNHMPLADMTTDKNGLNSSLGENKQNKQTKKINK